MKKLLLLLVAFISLQANAQLGKPGRKIGFSTPPVNNFLTLNTEENLFDNVHYMYRSLGWNGTSPTGTIAVAGGEVGKFNTMKGGVDIPYTGRTATTTPAITLGNKIPTMVDSLWITFTNRPSTQYESATITTVAPPYENWFVYRYLPGQRAEEIFGGGDNGALVGDLNGSVRLINAQYSVAGSTFPTMYQIHLGRLVVNSNNTADWYLDGTYVGSVTFTDPADFPNKVFKKLLSVAVVSNNSDWQWAASYFKAGTFSSGTATTIATSLSTKWSVGGYPNQALVYGIRWDRTPSTTYVHGTTYTYTPGYLSITNTTGKTLKPASQWNWKWYWFDGATNFDTQTLFSTNYTVTTADFPVGFDNGTTFNGFSIKCTFQPVFTDGSVWGDVYLEGTMGGFAQQSQVNDQ